MTTSGQPPAVSKKRPEMALAFSLVFFPVWFLFGMALLLLSSLFLQVDPNAVTLVVAFIVSGDLAWLFRRLARREEKLKTLNRRGMAALVLSLVFFPSWFLFAAALLPLSFFLQDFFLQSEPGAVTLGGIFIVSGALAWLFLRLARSEERLKTLNRRAMAALVFSLTALAFSAVFVPAWIISAAGLLALSTFLPPWPSAVTLGGVLVASGALTWLLLRLAPVGESLKTLRDGSGPLKIRALGRLAAAIISLAAVSFAAVSGTHAVWHGRLAAFKQSLKEKGLPVTLRDLQENLPNEQYAYPWLSSEAHKKEFNYELYKKSDCYNDYTETKCVPEAFKKFPELTAYYTPYLEKKLMPLLKSRKYSRFKKVDYAHPPRNPYAMPIPQHYPIYSIARVSGLCAASRAAEGDIEKAWALIRLQFAMADLSADGKQMISKLVTVGLRHMAAKTALAVMQNRPEAVLPSDLARRFKGALSDHLISDGMQAELAHSFDCSAYMDKLTRKETLAYPKEFSILWTFGFEIHPDLGSFTRWLEFDIFWLLQHMGILDMNYLASVRYYAEFTRKGSREQLVSGDRIITPALERLPSWPYHMAKLISPQYFRVHEKEWELKAWTQLALACSELGRYRREHGRYPGKITKLASENYSAELLKDVFTGDQLVYIPSADKKSFELCSSGPKGDKKDLLGQDFCVRQ